MNIIKMMPKFTTLCAATMLISACSVFSGHETAGEYVDDATITSKVKSAMVADPALRPAVPQIHVETFRGVVQLSGFVPSEGIKRRADDVTSRVAGVKSIKDDLVVH